MADKTSKQQNKFGTYYKSHLVGVIIMCVVLVLASVAATKSFTVYTVVSGVMPFLLPVISWFANGRKGK